MSLIGLVVEREGHFACFITGLDLANVSSVRLISDLEKRPSMKYDLYNGTPPYEKSSDTSREAAQSILPAVGTLQSKVLGIFKDVKEYGKTCDDIEYILSGRHQSISARIRELVQLGHIVDSGRRRKTRSGRNAAVYVAVEYGLISLLTDKCDSFTPADYRLACDGK